MKKSNKMFCRVGGLSPVKQTHYISNEDKGFHNPPVRKGTYAFIWPYIEPFLFMWNEDKAREFLTKGIRKFFYEGYLWCHFTEQFPAALIKGCWVKVHTDDFWDVFHKKMIQDSKDVRSAYKKFVPSDNELIIRNPYKTSNGCFACSMDELEVFIERLR